MNVKSKRAIWFEVGFSYIKTMASGLQKRVREKFVFDGQDFLEAYTKAMEYADGMMEEYAVITMAIAPYAEYVRCDDREGEALHLYKVKLAFVVFDERTGKEKKSYATILVLAESITESREITVEYMRGTLADYAIESIIKTALVEVIDK